MGSPLGHAQPRPVPVAGLPASAGVVCGFVLRLGRLSPGSPHARGALPQLPRTSAVPPHCKLGLQPEDGCSAVRAHFLPAACPFNSPSRSKRPRSPRSRVANPAVRRAISQHHREA